MAKKKQATRVKLIANPGSGKMEGNRLLETVVLGLQERGMVVDVALARPNEEAIPIARQALKAGFRTFVVMGGDDTIWAVMRGLAGSKRGRKAALGIIAGGTSNNTARSLGIPEDDPAAACDLIAAGRTRKIDLGQVARLRQGKRKGRPLLFCELVTAGLSAELYPDIKDAPKGDLSRLKAALKTLIKHPTRPKFYLTLDDESQVKVETMLVTVANLPLMGSHMVVAPDAALDDGLLDVAVYPEFTKPQLLAYLNGVREEAGGADRLPGAEAQVQRYRVRKIKIKAKPKLAVLADGVELGKGTVQIKVRKRVLRVFAPPVGTGVESEPRPAVVELPTPMGANMEGAAA